MRLADTHLRPFLDSIREPAVTTRSKAGKDKDASAKPVAVSAADELPPLPIFEELTTAGLDAEQIWQQVEIQSKPMVNSIKAIIDEEGGEEGEEAGSDGDIDSDEIDLDSLSPEELQKLMDEYDDEDLMSGSDDDDDDDDDSDEDGESGSDDEDDTVRFYDDEDASDVGSDDEEEEEEDEDVDEDEEDANLGSSDAELEDGSDDGMMLSGEDEDDVDMDDGEEDDEDEEDDDADAAGLSLPGPSRKRRHPELDDNFFSIDDFNRQTEEAEAGRVTSGRLGGDDDDDDEEDDDAFNGDISSIMLRGAPEEDCESTSPRKGRRATHADGTKAIMYADFFEPPRQEYAPGKGSGKDKAKGKGKDAKGKGKAQQKARFEEEDLEQADGAGEDDEERGVMGRVKTDLFADEDEDEVPEQGKSAAHPTLPYSFMLSLPLTTEQPSRRSRSANKPLLNRLPNSSPRPLGPRTGLCWEKPRLAPGPRIRYWRRTSTLSTWARLCLSLPRRRSSRSRT